MANILTNNRMKTEILMRKEDLEYLTLPKRIKDNENSGETS